jgi:hypothetical protein
MVRVKVYPSDGYKSKIEVYYGMYKDIRVFLASTDIPYILEMIEINIFGSFHYLGHYSSEFATKIAE